MTAPETPSDPAPEPAAGLPPARRQRSGRKVLWRVLLVLLAVVLLFHRPLFHRGMPLLIKALAARAHMEVDVRFSGNLFSQLTIGPVQVRPAPGHTSPVERIEVQEIQLRYSLPRMLRRGPGEFLSSYEIRQARVELRPIPRSPKEKKRRKTVGEIVHLILAQPAAYADRVLIEALDVRVALPNGDKVAVEGVDLLLDPTANGWIRARRVAIPRLPVWQNLRGETQYRDRNLFVRQLALDPRLVVRELNFDASQRAQHRGRISLKADCFGGQLDVALSGEELRRHGGSTAKTPPAVLQWDARNVSLDDLGVYFHLPLPPLGKLERFSGKFTGDPERPRTWEADLALRTAGTHLGALVLDSFRAAFRIRDGQMKLGETDARIGKNALQLSGVLSLPPSFREAEQTRLELGLQLDASDLAAATRALATPLGGGLQGRGQVSLAPGRVRTRLSLEAKDLSRAGFAIHSGAARLNATHKAPFTSGRAVADLESELQIDAEGLSGSSFQADSAKVVLETLGHTLNLRLSEIRRAENLLSVSGSYDLPRKPGEAALSAVTGKFTFNAPKLDAFGIRIGGEVLKGTLLGEGAVERRQGEWSGTGRIDGKEFQIGGFQARRLGAAVALAGQTVTVEEAALELNKKDRIAAAGKLQFAAPFLYEGGAIVSIGDLAVFQPLLDLLKIPGPIKGALELDWNGRAESSGGAAPAERAQSGDMKLRLSKARYGTLNLDQFSFAGAYRPGFAQTTELKLLSGPTRLEGVLEWEAGKLRFRDIALDQGKQHALTGYVIVPLDLEHPKKPFPLDQRIAANVNLKDLDLGQLLASFGKSSPVTGSFSASLIAGGTLLAPTGHIKVAGRKLQAKSLPQLDPADLDLALHYSNKDLSLEATLRDKQLQPLTLKGRVPLDLTASIQNRALDRELPLDLQLRLPSSSLSSLPKLVPAIRKADGTIAIEANVGGTLAAPLFKGATTLKLASLRLSKENIPPLSGFEAQLVFAEDKVTVKTFRGEVAGGRLELGGQVDLKKPAEPVFDLRMKADKVLVLRNDALTMRVDTDLRLAGPLNTALASGTVFITESRFFREIDILPIGLPGKPKPKPRAAPSAKTFSLPKAPFRDWKFDIAIRTRSSDPFRIRGNLANGTAAADLKLTGSGLQPNLEGNVRVENFVASLPFSKLSVNQGFLYFSPEAPLDPSLDLQAESTVRDYRVTAYVYGTVSDPQVTIISEPPLPQAEIISLLATGTTTSELNGTSQSSDGGVDVRASRAALLVFQQLYRKMFKTKEAPQEPSFLDRFSVDLGSIDNRTGRQEISTSFRIGKNLYLIGDVDVQGYFTGRLRYLLRFR